MQDRKNFTYVKKASGKERGRVVWAVVFPVGVFFLSIIGISIFKNFGRILMAPLIGGMWIAGAVCAFYMPSHRKDIIKETLTAIASYNATLLGLRELISITSGVSSQMLMATFGQPLATASANTIPGYLQTMLYISTVMIPFGYFGMQGKRILQFRRSANKQRTMEQLRSIRRK